VHHRRRVELDVRVQPLIWLALVQQPQRLVLDHRGELEELNLTSLLGELAQDLGARIFGFVHSVTKSHQALAMVERVG